MSGFEMLTQVRPRMGTLLAVSLPAPGSEDQQGYARTAFDSAARAERIMSRHDPESPLNCLNRRAGQPTGTRSPELAPIVRAACHLSKQLNGAFDPTVAPVLDLWRAAAHRGRAASQRELRHALSCVGPEGIVVRGDHIALTRPGMALDLGAFGKGVALDHIAAMLRQEGCSSAFVNFGESSLLAIGRPPGTHWSVALRDPFGDFVGEFVLRDRAASTSSTVSQTVRVRRRVVGHIVDPRTGEPLSGVAQVTVLGESAAIVEAVSTALLVLGRGAIDEIADRMQVDVCWIDVSGIYTTPRFLLRRFA
jgi:thiamine biosynthesis lipoprotein